jgi:hypothetical protein
MKTSKTKKDINTDDILNGINFNFNRLCALDIRTAGTEIVEICMYPINWKFELAKSILPYYCLIQPIKSPFYIKDNSEYVEMGITEKYYLKAYNHGLLKSQAFDLLEKWCDKKIDLLPGRKIMPLTYDWGKKREILINWMGPKNFEHYFHFHVRDILPMGLFGNDFANLHYQRCPYPKVDFAYLCSQTKTEHSSTDTLLNCVAIAKVYHTMLNSWYKGHNNAF